MFVLKSLCFLCEKCAKKWYEKHLTQLHEKELKANFGNANGKVQARSGNGQGGNGAKDGEVIIPPSVLGAVAPTFSQLNGN